jgi:hypothetical protein
VEFEPGDTIRFKSDYPVQVHGDRSTELEVRRAFDLNEISAHLDDGAVEIGLSETKRQHWVFRDLRTPPPPPPGVTIVVENPASHKQQAGAATGT